MNNIFDTDVQIIKNKVLTRVAELAYEDALTPQAALRIPKEIIPDGSKATMRCCIYKERAILEERVQVALGGDRSKKAIVEVMPIACDECPADGIKVTETCRGCLAHRCLNACPKGAIEFNETDRRAVIDKTKCIDCGRCAAACSYNAIVRHVRPCVNACKPGALTIDRATQKASIDDSKCISCGQCVYQCPFGAVVDRSFITDIIKLIRDSENNTKYHVYAVVAPAISAQYNSIKEITTEKIVTGIKQLGFHTVIEAAWGADMVAWMEANELVEKGFLTSSCCPAFVNYIHSAFPKLVPNISHNLSPMAQMAKSLKKMDPGCKCVFIGPCIAKKTELYREAGEYMDAIMTFEEMQAMFTAKHIDLATLEESVLDNASYYGRIFARSGGLTEAVGQVMKERGISADQFKVNPVVCNGIAECKTALFKANRGILKENFIEGMSCEGGCIGGPACIAHTSKDAAQIDKYGKTAVEQTIQGAIAVLEGYQN